MTEKRNLINNGRTEEVQDIIDRMPTTFARNITLIVCLIIILLLFFGYTVRYPDIVSGEATISAEQSPLQIVAVQTGRLKLNKIKSQDFIEPDQLLAWIDNPAKPNFVRQIKNTLATSSVSTSNAQTLYRKLPKNLNLGDLTIPYSSFLTSVRQLADYQVHKLYDKQASSFTEILNEQNSALITLKERERLTKESLKIANKYIKRDSILFAKRLISESEFEKSLITQITVEDEWKGALRNSGAIREQISTTENSIQQNKITKSEKELQLNLEFLTSYNNLIDKITLWEKQYLITSPVSGNAQFLKFWTDNQFVQSGEALFSIVPKENKALGKVMLPVQGAGKVEVGQKVIVKMSDYPYMEYGYIEGKVENISMVSTPINYGNGTTMESYLVSLVFPEGLKTNYGLQLDFRFETKGVAEIITKDRRLIERFFDNLKYIGNSK